MNSDSHIAPGVANIRAKSSLLSNNQVEYTAAVEFGDLPNYDCDGKIEEKALLEEKGSLHLSPSAPPPLHHSPSASQPLRFSPSTSASSPLHLRRCTGSSVSARTVGRNYRDRHKFNI